MTKRLTSILLAFIILEISFNAQTRITPPKNPYRPSDDVKLGRQANAEVTEQLKILDDPEVERYIMRLGRHLVNSIPSQFQYPEFEYSFKVVESADINAFALPGGYTYVNTGLIDVARNEGELAGVMAHEIAHVALRHGTAQLAQGRKYQIGAVVGTILGSIVGGNTGTAIAQGSQIGFGAYLLKFSREHERQADLLGAQIMAAAGYDPRDLANMFQTIERASGGRGGPEWLSSHPNPGNRYSAINKEAQSLRIANSPRNNKEFARIQELVRHLMRSSTSRLGSRVDSPSSRMRTYRASLFRISVPQNWRELEDENSVTFAPEGGYARVGQQTAFSHCVIAGTVRTQSRDLEKATERFLDQLTEGNPKLRRQGRASYTAIDRREALMLQLSNRSEITAKDESVTLYTTLLPEGSLFYIITVVPTEEQPRYDRLFADIVDSVRIE
ncbi:MAG: M48 family metallopeptidase [Acidobacteriota bacterium]|nr:M48 family metallopeptidase [Blastocatellia bacterium]MDW8412402.1 M48 family metallopeptidase [Acidobacteriota bacterium]